MTLQSVPVVLVIFGGTGDLFRRKLAPSLMTLHEEGKLPQNLLVIGTGRTAHTDVEYQAFASSAIKEIISVDAAQDFLSHFTYVSGELHEQSFFSNIQDVVLDFEKKHGMESHVVWYCSIAPHFYADIAQGISDNTIFLKRPLSANSFLIEKPIGHNAESCVELNDAIAKYFDESQITRIEHYLTKETLVRLPDFLEKHKDMHALFVGDSVASIDVDFYETIGVEKRGAFYDSVGAFRDVGQNHALEMLAHVCMDYSSGFSGDTLLQSRIHFLKELAGTSPESVTGVRYQYAGYQNISGVRADSRVETAYRVKGVLPEQRWKQVPFRLTGGKRVGEKRKRILLSMRDGVEYQGVPLRQIVISIDPECVVLVFANGTQEASYFRPGHKPKYQYVEEYSRILYAGFMGQRTYSVSSEEVLLLWKITDRYTALLENSSTPPVSYLPDTNPFTE